MNESQININLKKEICEYFPKLKRVHTTKRCFINCEYARDITKKILLKLPDKYKRDYLIYLDSVYIINIQNIYTFEFILKHFKDIVRYIENRDKLIHNDVIQFIFCFYNEYNIKIPFIVNFRDLMCSVTEYFSHF